MAKVAKNIKGNGGTIFLPFLDNDPLVSERGRVACGSVPDRIYALISEDKKENIENALKTIIKEIIENIIQATKKVEIFNSVTLNSSEITDFFNFFFIFHEIKGNEPEYYEFLEAERKISMRYAIRTFEQSSTEVNKWEKCDLCGNRKMVYGIQQDYAHGTKFHNIERICSVCVIKRFLPEIMERLFENNKEIEFVEPQYKSTSDIAAIPLNAHFEKLKHLTKCHDEVQKLVSKLKQEYKEKLKEEQCKTGIKLNLDIDEGRSFFDLSLPSLRNFRKKYKECEDTIKKAIKDFEPLRWLDRPFFCVVYMDGDNMSDILRVKRNAFSAYTKKVSELIAQFSRGVYDIVIGYEGQLIFAGGEDITFVIHPECLLECIARLTTEYNSIFLNDPLTKPDSDRFTLSAGAVVAYHKYPLSRVIENSYKMLTKYAKNHPDKNATAISLIKGHTEVLNFTISNNLINDVIGLKRHLLSSDISRTTPYRIAESRELLKVITDDETKENYLRSIIEATRDVRYRDMDNLVKLLMKFRDIDTMIDVLLFARFLAGEKNA